MNTPESIVVDLEHAKMLKEAGWPQDEALLWWASKMHPDPYDESIVWELSNDSNPIGTHDWCKQAGTFAAPTAQEIETIILKELPHISITISRMGEMVCLEPLENRKYTGHVFKGTNHANAASEMWCYLKKNNLLPQNS